MKKLGTLLTALALADDATAVPINGEILFDGGATFDRSLGLANSVTGWVGPEVVSRDGDFAAFVAVGDAVAMTAPWIFDPSTPLAGLWAVGGFVFDLAASEFVLQRSGFLAVGGTGTLRGNGYDDTAGVWGYSNATPHSGGVFFFVASTAATPSPRVPDSGSTAMLLGLAVIGLGLISAKFRVS